ncbi:MAG: FTR1 family protein [Gordonia sp. (in: high G+C Gram-positive bacteria)]
MFATLIIGLREGLEAALIVGIIAAFLRRQGRIDALRWMWAGVVVALIICASVAAGLEILSRDLPQQQQEALETVIGVIAVAMVTYMIVWMRAHARDLKGDLEAAASEAIREGSAVAFVMMAFLAVLREGLETAVFLVAAFNASHNAGPSAAGAVIGILIAVVLGYGIYRGGVHLNLARFFKITGLLLALVAAGLVMTALRTAHEAGWVNSGQQEALDLTWLVRPGSLRSSLLTGVLGIQSKPVLIEVIGWSCYLLIVGSVVLWPAHRPAPRKLLGRIAAALAAVSAGAAVVLLIIAPSAPTLPSRTITASVSSVAQTSGILAGTTARTPGDTSVTIHAAHGDSATGSLRTGSVTTALPSLVGSTTTQLGSLTAPTFEQIVSPDIPIGQLVPDAPTSVDLAQVIAANAGRIPVGLDTRKFGTRAPVIYTASADVITSVDPAFSRPLALKVAYAVTATVTPAHGPATVLGKVVTFTAEHQPSPAEISALAAASDQRRRHHTLGVNMPISLAVGAIVLAAIAAGLLVRRSRSTPSAPVSDDGTGTDSAAKLQPIEEKENIR